MASGGSRYSAFYVATATGTTGSAYSCRTGLSQHRLFRNKVVVTNSASTDTLAHELGHHLINSGAHPAGTIMGARPRPTEITGPQCASIYARA